MANNEIHKKDDTEESKDTAIQEIIETNVNTDGREPYDWESKYPLEARKKMKGEAIYIGVVLFFSLVGLFLNWCGIFSNLLKVGAEQVVSSEVFEGTILYFFSGLLGGTIFGIKYFYRVVARGYWTQDRRYWRIFSPWVSSCIALVVGCMVVSGYINADQNPSIAVGTCIGFIAGYFADEAVGKMSEVATALFGSNTKAK